MKKLIFGFLRYIPSLRFEFIRGYYYKIFKINVGRRLRLSVGSILDVWNSKIPFSMGNDVYIGENSYISGGVTIGDNTSINSNVCITASPPNRIHIGNDCLIAQNVVIRANDHRFSESNLLIREQGKVGQDIFIGNDCWIAANVVILKGVHIGSHSVVGAGAIVTKSFPEWSVIVGNPAKLIKKRIK
ncbi:acyltransferase [Leptospira levettii]|uniref:acyltransferase n=1 Tax=Leptospira levettii TaxID=2023178 RepID=UPI002AC85919|nr:DapH/DapD/GlmU-related protein [Leptospira levettii]